MYQNPNKFPITINLVEFDLPKGLRGNHFVTYVEYTRGFNDHWGTWDGEEGSDIPDDVRLQIALQIAGDLVQPIQK
jgi:hypothetical protein